MGLTLTLYELVWVDFYYIGGREGGGWDPFNSPNITTEMFKKHLDEWLMKIPDQPKIDDYAGLWRERLTVSCIRRRPLQRCSPVEDLNPSKETRRKPQLNSTSTQFQLYFDSTSVSISTST